MRRCEREDRGHLNATVDYSKLTLEASFVFGRLMWFFKAMRFCLLGCGRMRRDAAQGSEDRRLCTLEN